MAAPVITQLPTPPSRQNAPAEFVARADAFLGALPQFRDEANTSAQFVDQRAADSAASATAANSSRQAAQTAANNATTNGQTQVNLAKEEVTKAAAQAALATTNGAAQVTLAAGHANAAGQSAQASEESHQAALVAAAAAAAGAGLPAMAGKAGMALFVKPDESGVEFRHSAETRVRIYKTGATWTKSDGLKGIRVSATARGGNGGDLGSGGSGTRTAPGGGGGGTAIKVIAATDLPGSVAITVGTTAEAGTSSFGAFCSALPGGNATTSNPGLGGDAVGGDINIPGGAGHPAMADISGRGGDSLYGHGARAVTSGNAADGVAATGYGAGGSGARTTQSGARPGGLASPGIVIVEEFY